jgi:hypothetical protein
MTIEDKAQDIIAGLYIPTSEDRTELVQRIVDVLTDSGHAQAACAEMASERHQLFDMICQSEMQCTQIDDETPGECGNEELCPFHSMLLLCQDALNPGSAILYRLAAAKKLAEDAEALVDTMETCHICKGTIMVGDPKGDGVHCEDCTGDCDSHDEPNCHSVESLHTNVKRALAAYNASSAVQAATKETNDTH